jgi:hypothetical protein
MWFPKRLSGECRGNKGMSKAVRDANFSFSHWLQNQPQVVNKERSSIEKVSLSSVCMTPGNRETVLSDVDLFDARQEERPSASCS